MVSIVRRPFRRPFIIAAIFLTAVILFAFLQREQLAALHLQDQIESYADKLHLHEQIETYTDKLTGVTPFLRSQREFWQDFYHDLTECLPLCDPLTHPPADDEVLANFFDKNVPRDRPDLMELSDRQLHAMTDSHSSFVERIRNKNYSLPYQPGTRGLVTTAGGSYLRNALVSVRMLRRTGSTLPVEIFLKDKSEFDPDLCGSIFPKLNAKCLLLTDIFGSHTGKIENYQLKVMAILFSSFEEVLMLDSDCFPIYDPNQLFDQPPFTETGLVLWPDFWYPTESPRFFDIAGIATPPVNERPSTEAGEILYSKRKHEDSILLAAYYNYYGPGYYYPLQSQGAPGEGDKETFLWSAIVMDNELWSVNQAVKALGYHSLDSEWRGSAMAQFDPVEDALATTGNRSKITPTLEKVHTALSNTTNTTISAPPPRRGEYPRAFFLHVNFPKIDPQTIFYEDTWTTIYDSDMSQRRIWHNDRDDAISFFGFDAEEFVWREVRDMTCEYTHTFKEDTCLRAKGYVRHVFGSDDRYISD